MRVSKFEKGSLFLEVPRAKAEEAVWPAIKYWINHTFEIYGVEASAQVMCVKFLGCVWQGPGMCVPMIKLLLQ